MDPLPSSKPFQKYSWSVTDKEGECFIGVDVGSGGNGHGLHLSLEWKELNC